MKKTSIKLLALVMAVLMLGAVCLTACTDSAAQDAAAAAQKTADEAKTAAEEKTTAKQVEDAIKKALEDAGFMAEADAYTKQAVEDLIAGEIAKLKLDETYAKAAEAAKKTDLNGYAKTSDLNNKADKTALDSKADKTALEAYATTQALNAVKEQLAQYAKSAQLDTLAGRITALEGKVDVAKVSTAIQTALANYVTTTTLTTELAKYQLKNEALTAADVQKMIIDTFKAFGVTITVEDGEFKADKKINEYLKIEDLADELDALWADYLDEEVTEGEFLATIADKMSLEDWTKANDTVLSSIILVRETIAILDKIDKEDGFIYTNANKNVINDKLVEVLGHEWLLENGVLADKGAFTFFKDTTVPADGKLDLVKTVPVSIGEAVGLDTLLEYRLLRVATVEEMTKIAQTLKAIVDVTTFEDELKALWTNGTGATEKIADIGTAVEYGTYPSTDSKVFTKTGKTQMVTIADKADFYSISKAYDALLVKYVNDKAFSALPNTEKFQQLNNLSVTCAYKATKGTDTKYVYGQTAAPAATGDYEGYTFEKVTGTDTVTYDTDAKKAWMPVGGENAKTIYRIPQQVKNGANTINLFTYVDANYNKVVNDYKNDTSTTYRKYTTDINKGIRAAAGYNGVVSGIAAGCKDDAGQAYTVLSDAVAKADKEYGAIYLMLTDCQYYIDLAYAQFVELSDADKTAYASTNGMPLYNLSNAFLEATVFDGCTTNNEYLAKLNADLYEPKDATAATSTTTIWLDKGDFENEVKTANVVTYMNEAMMINALTGEKVADIAKVVAKYDLYDAMLGEAYKGLFDKYQARALKALETIYNDYRSVYIFVEDIAKAGVNIADKAAIEAEFTKDAADITAFKSLLGTNTDITISVAGDPATTTLEFIKAFFKGENVPAGSYANLMPTGTEQTLYNNADFQSKVNFGLEKYFYDGDAAFGATEGHPENEIKVNPVQTIYENIKSLGHDLQCAQIQAKAAILNKKVTDITGADREAKNANARQAFKDLIGPAFEYFNEIYFRYLFEDMKMSAVANLYDQVVANAGIATANGITGDNYVNSSADTNTNKKTATQVDAYGYAEFFIPNRASITDDLHQTAGINTPVGLNNRALEVALQLYLLGYSTQGADNEKITTPGVKSAGDKFMVDERTGVTKYDFNGAFGDVVKGTFYNSVKNIGTNLTEATLSETDIEIVATATDDDGKVAGPLKDLADAVATAKTEMEGICIKFYFNTYMTEALKNLNAAHNNYLAAVDLNNGIANKNKMKTAISEKDNDIALPFEMMQTAYLTNKNVWTYAEYTQNYITVLNTIARYDDIMIALTGRSFETALKEKYEKDNAADLEKKDAYKIVSFNSDATTVLRPVKSGATTALAAYNTIADYWYVGSAVAEFEKLFNPASFN